MPQLQQGAIGRILQKLLGLEGPSPTPTVSPELVATVLAANATDPEWHEPTFVRIAGSRGYQAAGGAGNYACVDLVNPIDSGCIIVLEHARFYGASQVVDHKIIVAPAGISITTAGYYRNANLKGRSIGGIHTTATTPVAGNLLASTFCLTSNQPYDWDVPVVLYPNSVFRLAAASADTALTASMQWREIITQATS